MLHRRDIFEVYHHLNRIALFGDSDVIVYGQDCIAFFFGRVELNDHLIQRRELFFHFDADFAQPAVISLQVTIGDKPCL